MLKKQIIIQKELSIILQNPILLFYQSTTGSTKEWHVIKNSLDNVEGLLIQNKSSTKILQILERDIVASRRFFHSTLQKEKLKKKRKNSIPQSNQEVLLHKVKERTYSHEECDSQEKWSKYENKSSSEQILKQFTISHFSTQPRLKDHEVKKKEHKNQKEQSLNQASIKTLLHGPTILLGCKTEKQLVSIWNSLNPTSGFLCIAGFYENQPLSPLCFEKFMRLDDSLNSQFVSFLEYKKSSVLCLQNFQMWICSTFENFASSVKKRSNN